MQSELNLAFELKQAFLFSPWAGDISCQLSYASYKATMKRNISSGITVYKSSITDHNIVHNPTKSKNQKECYITL